MTPLENVSREYVSRHWRSHVVAAVAGLFLALVGALGTGAAPWFDRLVFWMVLLQAGSLCASAVGVVAARRPRIGESVILRWGVTTLAVAAPMALLSWGLARLVFAWEGPLEIALFVWASLLVTGTMTALMMTIGMPGRATQGPRSPPGSVKLRERLQPPFRGADIYAVSAEDHYLRVHTSAGATLILMRLADALMDARDLLRGVDAGEPDAHPAMITLHPDGRAEMEALDGRGEFPRVDPRRVGRRTRYTYGVINSGLARWDWQSGEGDRFVYSGDHWSEEPIFVPRRAQGREADGWIVATALNTRAERTELAVFDARRLRDGPVALLACPYALPLGFHGAFAM